MRQCICLVFSCSCRASSCVARHVVQLHPADQTLESASQRCRMLRPLLSAPQIATHIPLMHVFAEDSRKAQRRLSASCAPCACGTCRSASQSLLFPTTMHGTCAVSFARVIRAWKDATRVKEAGEVMLYTRTNPSPSRTH